MTKRATTSIAKEAPADQPATGGGAPPSHPALIALAKALARLAVEQDIAAAKAART